MMNRPTSPLSYYLHLQYRRLFRTLHDNGLYPWLVIPLCLLVFVFISFRILNGMTYGEYIYAVLGLSWIVSIADTRRYNFVKSITSDADYKIIRLAENLIILFPFIVGLLIYGKVLPAVITLLIGVPLSFINWNISLPYAMPTPFGSRPFEFARGFRGAGILIIGCYIIVPLGISVNNFNLALSSIAGTGLIAGSYFIQPEPRFYVWMHAETVQQFLINKSKTILLYSLMCMLPIIVTLFIFDPSKIATILLIVLAAIAFVEMCMLAKYLAYPSEVNIIAGLAMLFSILFPPMMLVIIPVFYFKARRRLDQYLR